MAVGTILKGISLGISLTDSIFGAGKKRKEASRQLDLVREEMDTLRDFKGDLSGIYDERKRFATDRFGNTLDSITDRLGMDLSTSRRQTESVQRRSGLEYTSTEAVLADQEEAIRSEGQRSQREAGMNFEQNQFELNVERSRELGEIDQRLAALQGEADLLSEAKKEKFLGLF